METNPIWELVFWCFWATLGIEFLVVLIAVNVKHYWLKNKRKRKIKKAPNNEVQTNYIM